jgi:hypothetical protein
MTRQAIMPFVEGLTCLADEQHNRKYFNPKQIHSCLLLIADISPSINILKTLTIGVFNYSAKTCLPTKTRLRRVDEQATFQLS